MVAQRARKTRDTRSKDGAEAASKVDARAVAAVLVGSTMSEEIGLRPEQIAVLRAQLKAANERLLAIEHQREQMQTYIATLADQLKRAETGRDG